LPRDRRFVERARARVSKSTGNPFVTATLRCKDDDTTIWLKLLVFGADAKPK
jgi:hypothetical protein